MVRSGMVIVLITLGLVAGSGCQHSASQPAAPKPPTIPVSRPVQREVTDYVDYTGRTDAVESVGVWAAC